MTELEFIKIKEKNKAFDEKTRKVANTLLDECIGNNLTLNEFRRVVELLQRAATPLFRLINQVEMEK